MAQYRVTDATKARKAADLLEGLLSMRKYSGQEWDVDSLKSMLAHDHSVDIPGATIKAALIILEDRQIIIPSNDKGA